MILVDSNILMRLARDILEDHDRLTARDALHAAVVRRHELEASCSYDRDFDGVAGVRRVDPARMGAG